MVAPEKAGAERLSEAVVAASAALGRTPVGRAGGGELGGEGGAKELELLL